MVTSQAEGAPGTASLAGDTAGSEDVVTRTGVADLRAFLLGSWRIDRHIRAAGAGSIGWFVGHGRFDALREPTPHLLYTERGTVWLDGHRGPATRRLRYHVDGAQAQVTFDDGRAFHALDLRDGVDEVDHPCRDDHYRGRFEVLGADEWRHEWHVVGPDKDHVLTTTLTRHRP